MSSPGNAANRLEGLALQNGWVVEAKLPTGHKNGGSGGFFSVSYSVRKGQQLAFLKAFDIFTAIDQAVANGQQFTTALMRQTQAYEFEAELHKACVNMKRVVRILEHGQVSVPPLPGEQFSVVPFMIMELADGGDVRSFISRATAIDTAMKLYYLRDVASGLQQLHGASIAHQDLKPSNVMIFGTNIAKIGDLGRASQQNILSQHDDLVIAGDRGYAPPEQIYRHPLTDWVDRRQRCDLYQFGSLIAFLFFGTTINASFKIRLTKEALPVDWGGECTSYVLALPFLIQSFNDALAEWKQQVPEWLGNELTGIIGQLSNPDYTKRGSEKSLSQSVPVLGMNRFVGKLNTLAQRASIEARKIKPLAEVFK